MTDMREALEKDYRLTTAEIFYFYPDHPSLLQTFVWQHMDLPPSFPVLLKFLRFWEHSIEGKLHSVTVGHCQLIKPGDIAWRDHEWVIH